MEILEARSCTKSDARPRNIRQLLQHSARVSPRGSPREKKQSASVRKGQQKQIIWRPMRGLSKKSRSGHPGGEQIGG